MRLKVSVAQTSLGWLLPSVWGSALGIPHLEVGTQQLGILQVWAMVGARHSFLKELLGTVSVLWEQDSCSSAVLFQVPFAQPPSSR